MYEAASRRNNALAVEATFVFPLGLTSSTVP